MLLTDFDYHLPDSSIAQTPAEPRDSARLLCLDRHNGQIDNKIFSDITAMLSDNDVIVINETRVINARLKGQTLWNERDCEVFLHKQISEDTWDCLVYPWKRFKLWAKAIFPWSELEWTVVANSKMWRIIEFSHNWKDFLDIIEQIWEAPLPPYIKNTDTSSERYQTVYNDYNKSGSVAAPTAGLHFTPELIKELQEKWVKIEKVCLHVGLGTFLGVEVENIKDHNMHSEQIYIEKDVSDRLNSYKSDWRRIIAIGTTSVRTLESFTDKNGQLWYWQKDTDIFIYPGYEWKFVESIITNFHLPRSTLLMLVSSFAGVENIKKAYQHGVDSDYRFFSFWDAMWIM